MTPQNRYLRVKVKSNEKIICGITMLKQNNTEEFFTPFVPELKTVFKSTDTVAMADETLKASNTEYVWCSIKILLFGSQSKYLRGEK